MSPCRSNAGDLTVYTLFTPQVALPISNKYLSKATVRAALLACWPVLATEVVIVNLPSRQVIRRDQNGTPGNNHASTSNRCLYLSTMINPFHLQRDTWSHRFDASVSVLILCKIASLLPCIVASVCAGLCRSCTAEARIVQQ